MTKTVSKFCLAALLAGVSGCTGLMGVSALTPEIISFAQTELHQIDGFYDGLVDQKAVPDHTAEATIALSGLDMAAQIFKGILQGKQASDAKINQAAAAVKGGELIAANLANQ